jgi:ubiquinone/menaquinone biosynthesis C-methylase UbiE
MADHKSSLTNHNPTNYAKHASFVYSDKYASPVLDLLAAQPGETIVDLGCGTGQLTEKIRAAVGPNGSVYGVDSSESMVRPLAIKLVCSIY